jgi:hypothetical protein
VAVGVAVADRSACLPMAAASYCWMVTQFELAKMCTLTLWL